MIGTECQGVSDRPCDIKGDSPEPSNRTQGGTTRRSTKSGQVTHVRMNRTTLAAMASLCCFNQIASAKPMLVSNAPWARIVNTNRAMAAKSR